ncbi:MAG: 4Fe-4S dicluster domain-containing protein [Coriobacteriales bacterium]|jgi:ferredoxin|nr:4Fe-4S dicluster domain-containing protein [Coriobacteriales bacterium]
MDIISLIETVVPSAYSGTDIEIDRAACIGVNRTRNYCRLCADICPQQAITFHKSTQISLDHDACSHCGACLTVCPVQAVRSHWLDDERLYARLAGGSTLLLCEPAAECLKTAGAEPEGMVTVLECLDRLDEAQLLYLLVLGDGQVDLVTENCSTCAIGCDFGMSELICEYTTAIIDALGVNAAVRAHRVSAKTLNEVLPVLASSRPLRALSSSPVVSAEGEVDRREAFSALKTQALGIFSRVATQATSEFLEASLGQGASLARVEQTPESQPPPFRQEMARRCLLTLLDAAADPAACVDLAADTTGCDTEGGRDTNKGSAAQLPSRLWGYPHVNPQKCVKCKVCSTLCPMQAITQVRVGARVTGLDIRPWRCVQCGRCAAACAHKAIRIQQLVPADLILKQRTVAERFVATAAS